jgi:hypothetical protein
MAALSKIGGRQSSTKDKSHVPIFQRDAALNEKQALRDAANALSALWKISKSSER